MARASFDGQTQTLMKRTEDIVESLIFSSRWVQAPAYVGLILGSALYTYKFLEELKGIWLC